MNVISTSSYFILIRIYTGRDGTFTLYDDEGDNYNYEKGNCNEIPIILNEKKQILTLGKRIGSYKNQTAVYTMNVVWISGNQNQKVSKTIPYTAKDTFSIIPHNGV